MINSPFNSRLWRVVYRVLTLLVVLVLVLPAGIVSAASSEPLPNPAPNQTPATPNQVSPSGVVSSNQPTYTWNEVPGATHYLFFINDNGVATNVWWYSRTEALCNGYTCSVKLASTLTTGKTYSWYVLAKDAGGYSSWAGPMYFGYGISAPAMASLTSPTGCITGTTTPTYSWAAVSGATDYLFFVYDPAAASGSQAKGVRWYTAAEANCSSGTGTCSVTPSVTLATGDFYWWVMAHNIAGDTWSYGMPFYYGSSAGANPTTPTPSTPTGSLGTAAEPINPDFIWTGSSDVTNYLFYIEDTIPTTPEATRIKWYTASEAACSSDTSCSVKASSQLYYGSYNWYVLAKNRCGYSGWSSAMSFYYYPAALTAPTLREPIGGSVINTSSPTYRWDRVAGATQYYIYLANATTGAPVANATYTRSESNCETGSTCYVTPSTSSWVLTDGTTYRWNVTAMNPINAPMVSSDAYFTYNSAGTLSAPTTLKVTEAAMPAACASGLPTYTWLASPGATDYRAEVLGTGTYSVSGTWLTASALSCTTPGSTCSWTPAAASYNNTTGLGDGACPNSHSLVLQAKSASTTSASTTQTFQMALYAAGAYSFYEAVPAAPTITAPLVNYAKAAGGSAITYTAADYTEAASWEIWLVESASTTAPATCVAGTCVSGTYTAALAGCSADNSCDTSTSANIDISAVATFIIGDTLQIFVRGVNTIGNGTWSSAGTVVVN